ncbi:nuclear factor interleukin-3-regulated protein-like [Anableps anableps]
MTAQTVDALFPVMPPLLHADAVALGGPGSGSDSYSEKTVSILNTQTYEARACGLDFQESLASPEDMAATGFDENNGNSVRRKREFTPSERKDENYWDKRRKNNEAAKRSREKRRANDMVLERRVLGLLEENARLKAEVLALKFHFGMVKDPSDVSILPLSTPPSLTQFSPSNTDGLSLYNTHQTHCQPVQQGVVRTTISPQTACGDSSIRPCFPQADSIKFYDDPLDEWVRPPPTQDQQVCEAGSGRPNSSDGLRNLPHKLRFKSPPDGRMSSSPDNRPAGPPVALVEPSIQLKNTQQVGWGGQTGIQAPYSKDGAFGGCEQQQIQGSSCGLNDSSFLQNSNRKFSGGDVSLRSHISTLSQEVAQLRRLLSQQLLHKVP